MNPTHPKPPRRYVTTAIPYVNGAPHLGHAQEAVLTDALVRYARLSGEDVRSQTGTDDNSLKNALAAEAEGVDTASFVAARSGVFRRLQDVLQVELDDFIETSRDPRHTPAVLEIWRRCQAAGDIYKKPYRGLYCVGCEQFYAEDELSDGVCPDHRVAPELVEEENYFFRLSRYQRELEALVGGGGLRVEGPAYRREMERFVESGLQDFSISRSRERARGWGIPVPDDDAQIVYVWFDALINYVSALGWPGDPDGLYARYWAEADRRVHVIGKGVTRFHIVYWPAILLSAGLPLPTDVLTHGYVTARGQKLSKSLGNAGDPFEATRLCGSDALRYFLIRHVHTTSDGDFSAERLVAAHDGELANQLGNLVRRTLRLVVRDVGGAVPAPDAVGEHERALVEVARESWDAYRAGFEGFALHDAAASLWRFIAAANRYADDTAPWQLAKRDDVAARQQLATVLYHLAESLRVIAVLAAPIVPTTAARVAAQLGLDAARLRLPAELEWGALPPGTRVIEGEVLFPKQG